MNNYIETEMLSIGKIKYKILNLGGNKTALIDGCEYTNNQKKLINKMIMDKHSQVEQVGFLSNKINRLEMAGGEFCVNATRCAIYEYSKKNKEKVELSVSGTNKKLVGRILSNNKVEVRLDIGKHIDDLIEIQNDFTCIKIDGILIAILDEEKSKKYIQKLKENEEIAKNELKQLMITKIDSEEKAIGIMLLEKELGKIKINPIVWVKEIDTVFYETACGSGSLGTAIYDENSQIVEWYFDIARRIGKENNVPYEDDLYLDVVVTPIGEIVLLDEDELQTAYNRLEVTKKDYDMAYNEANQLMKKLENNKDKLEQFTNKYLNEFKIK